MPKGQPLTLKGKLTMDNPVVLNPVACVFGSVKAVYDGWDDAIEVYIDGVSIRKVDSDTASFYSETARECISSLANTLEVRYGFSPANTLILKENALEGI